MAVALVGGAALASWDLFLDPQMVAAGHWVWADPMPALPVRTGRSVEQLRGVGCRRHRHDRPCCTGSSGPRPRSPRPAAALYLWAYASSVVAHAVFFGLPGSAVVGGLVMGVVAVPFARVAFVSRTSVKR